MTHGQRAGAPETVGIPESVKRELQVLALQIHNSRVPAESENPQRNNIRIPAGYTYLGQLIAHDLAFHDASRTRFAAVTRSQALPRTSMLDLDCLYGGGPVASPWLYEKEPGGLPGWRLKLCPTRTMLPCRKEEFSADLGDVNRHRCPFAPDPGSSAEPHTYEALIADPRNDQNILISQLTVLFCKFHNLIGTKILASDAFPDIGGIQLFEMTRHLVVSVYREIILHDFLQRLVRDSTYKDYLSRYTNGDLSKFNFIDGSAEAGDFKVPDVFWLAGFRVGHAMIQEAYNFNEHHDNSEATGPNSITVAMEQVDPSMMNTPITTDWRIDWQRFFFDINAVDFSGRLRNGRPVNFSHLIEPAVAIELARSRQFIAEDTNRSLTYFDFARGAAHGLPSAQELIKDLSDDGSTDQPLIARSDELSVDELIAWLDPDLQSRLASYDGERLSAAQVKSLAGNTPLLFYLLCEASTQEQGRCLGALGSVIVADVMIGALAVSKDDFSDAAAKELLGDTTAKTWSKLFPASAGILPKNMPDLLTHL